MADNRRFRILVVDDESSVRDSLGLYLESRNYTVFTAASAFEAVQVLSRQAIDLVLTDISMPEMSGLDLLDHVKNHNSGIDVILITGHPDVTYAIHAMRRGAYDFFTKPFNFDKVLLTIDRVREKQALRETAEHYMVLRREQEIAKETVLSLARIAEERDRGNLGHGRRVGNYAVLLGRRLCYSKDRQDTLRYGGILHDLGKIAIDDAILNKTGKLSDSEFTAMKRHSEVGEYILKPCSIFRDIAPIVRWHHERYDGTGYPDGLKGESIPLDARIICLVDYFDAITSERPYRAPTELQEALRDLQRLKGSFFDPVLVDLFVEVMQQQHTSAAASASTP